MVEVVTVGEAMLRCVNSQSGMLRTVGGAELNAAVSLSQLGREVSWISAVGNDAAGHKILYQSNRIGVDTSSVVIMDEYQTGEYTVDFDTFEIEYRRSESAFTNLSYTMLDLSLREYMQNARWLHISGITPLLGELPRGVWSTSMALAELDGVKISLDLNHRPALSNWNELWKIVEPHLRRINLLTLSEADSRKINQMHQLTSEDATLEDILIAIQKNWLVTWIACTIKRSEADGSQKRWSIIAGPQEVVSSRGNPTVHSPVEPLGGGDAWIGAILDGMLSNMPLNNNLHRADKYAALVQSSPGDLSTITKSQLDDDFIYATIDRLKKAKTIAILRGKNPDLMIERAKELVESGITAIEITLDSTDAFTTLQRLRAELPPDIIIGVGTVSKPFSQLPKANKLGATFCLSPDFPEGMIEVAEKLSMVPIVGASTVNQAMDAISAGAKAVKLFHATDDWEKSNLLHLQKNYPELIWIPVGGIGPEDRDKWETLGFQLLGMGSKLALLD